MAPDEILTTAYDDDATTRAEAEAVTRRTDEKDELHAAGWLVEAFGDPVTVIAKPEAVLLATAERSTSPFAEEVASTPITRITQSCIGVTAAAFV